MAVIGTAGHVDHGKTTLVHALTGVQTDRLPEEKRRGITIELGFAPMPVRFRGNDHVLSIVDVPGHESFVGTMVAGAQGIDVALLVVAADAGVMPQTREHLVILAGLGVASLVVALTRCDVADAETRELARMDVEQAIAETRFRTARMFEVSGKTGEGIDELRTALAEAALGVDVGERKNRPFRLSVDRAFAPRGQGVVVTGTIVDGTVVVGDDIERWPTGDRLRVRGIHVHGKSVDRAQATGRVALALAGVELSQLRRGDVLSAPGSLLAARAFDAVLERPSGGRAFGRRARIAIHAGTDESNARLVPLTDTDERADSAEGAKNSATTIGGGERRLVRVVLATPLAVAVGDRLVARGDPRLASVGATLGALEVLRVAPGRLLGGRLAYGNELRRLLDADSTSRARFEIDASGVAGISASFLAPRLRRRSMSKDLSRGLLPLEQRGSQDPRYVGETPRAKVTAAIAAALGRYHEAHPDEEGAPLATALSVVPANAVSGLADACLDAAVAAGKMVRSGERVRLASFTPRARIDDPVAEKIVERLRAAGTAPPFLQEIADELGLSAERARAFATALASAGSLVHIQGDFWLAKTVIDDLQARVVAFIEKTGQMTTGELKDLVGASRKYVMPLAEWFDAKKVTLRVGDVRKLRKI